MSVSLVFDWFRIVFRQMPGRLAGPSVAALVIVSGAAAVRADYVPYSGIVQGTEGLDPLVLNVANETAEVIVCSVQLAHWYAADLGPAAPGEAVTATLWHDPADGSLSSMNVADDRMPVEAVWCAPAADPAARRSRVPLPIRAGPAGADSIAAVCRTGTDRMACDLR